MCTKEDSRFINLIMCISMFVFVVCGCLYYYISNTEVDGEVVVRYKSNNSDCVSADNADVLFEVVCLVESGDNSFAINEKEDAVGVVQIRPICVEDCNRISGGVNYCLRDRFDKNKSKEMFYLYTNYYMKRFKRTTNEDRCRIWNGGPKGWGKKSTVSYWDKVNSIYSKNIK